MRAWPLWLAALAACCTPAAAQVNHDTRLERAVMDLVARRIGDIRATQAPENLADLLAEQARAAARPGAQKDRGWAIVGGHDIADSTTTGSFQTFADPEAPEPAPQPVTPPKTVSRIIAF